MPISLPATFLDEIERPQQSNEMLWMFYLELSRATPTLPAVILRTTTAREAIQWPIGQPGLPTWYPFPFTFTPIEQNQEGDLPQVELTVDNSTRFLMPFLHEGTGIEGNRAILFLVPSNSLEIPFPDNEYQLWEMQVASVSASNEAIGIRLEKTNFFARTSPVDRFIPSRCRWAYGSEFCGYVLNEFAAYPRCNKTISACIERGADLEVRGLPVVLPGNFGGHPGVSVQR